jgi:DNA-binding transcriptional ArsR family regulator
MEMFEVLESFASLAQETRLRVYRLLLEYGAEGSPAGRVASELEIPDNTLSFHLSHMSKAGLVTSRKEGRTITYFANCDRIESLIDYLRENCCAREKKSRSKSRNCNERKC